MQQATEEVVVAAAAADGAAAAAAGDDGGPRRLSRRELKRMQVVQVSLCADARAGTAPVLFVVVFTHRLIVRFAVCTVLRVHLGITYTAMCMQLCM